MVSDSGFIAGPTIEPSLSPVNLVTCVAAESFRSWTPTRASRSGWIGPRGQGGGIGSPWFLYVVCPYCVQNRGRQSLRCPCKVSRPSGKTSRIRLDPLEKAASRGSVETARREKYQSSDFSIHIRPATDAFLGGQGVCAHNSGRNPPLAPLAFCSPAKQGRWGYGDGARTGCRQTQKTPDGM